MILGELWFDNKALNLSHVDNIFPRPLPISSTDSVDRSNFKNLGTFVDQIVKFIDS
jgi:hypothetical protein